MTKRRQQQKATDHFERKLKLFKKKDQKKKSNVPVKNTVLATRASNKPVKPDKQIE